MLDLLRQLAFPVMNCKGVHGFLECCSLHDSNAAVSATALPAQAAVMQCFGGSPLIVALPS